MIGEMTVMEAVGVGEEGTVGEEALEVEAEEDSEADSEDEEVIVAGGRLKVNI